ncbi:MULTISPECIES: choice-of-anchor G family protein [unclassified Curtobacterium]|uniref:choice-of-anchor G family protein n=2 Tax=Curtobacterium TaxID=2034 RepID=UPI001186E626|nr:choice-of-anchor G family protein [Curtobacterium sp. MR_MD2014]
MIPRTSPRQRPRHRARHRPAVLGMLRRGRGAVLVGIVAVVGATAAVTVPGPAPSTATWQDSEWVHGDGALGTSSFSCGEDVGYTANSSSRFLAGSVAGQDLGAVADLRGLDVTKTGTQGVSVSPATAPEITRTETTAAYGNPLDVGVLGSVAGLDLTGLGTGLPGGSAGAVNQVATSVATGRSVAASGLVSDSGGVLVTDTTPTEALPEPATLDLGQALAGVVDLRNVSDVGLEVGAVGSSAQLDGCDLLEDEVWGTAGPTAAGAGADAPTVRPALLAATGTTTAPVAAAAADGSRRVTRDYGIAGLDLRIDSPLVSSLTSSVDSTVRTLDGAVAQLAGPGGLLANAVRAEIGAELLGGTLRVGTVRGSVTLQGADLGTAIAPITREPLTDGVVTVDLASGSVHVDLARLVGGRSSGLNGLPPNTEIVLDAGLVDQLTARVTAMLDAWTQRIAAVLTSTLEALRLQVALDVQLLGLLGTPVVELDIRTDSGLGTAAGGSGTVTVGSKLLGLDLGLGGLVSLLVSGLTEDLPGVVQGVARGLLAQVTTAGSTLAAATGPLVAAVTPVLRALPALLSVQVNVQRDLPGSRDGRYARTGAYSVTAIRIGVLGPGGGTPLARVDLASSTVGPNLVDLGTPRS